MKKTMMTAVGFSLLLSSVVAGCNNPNPSTSPDGETQTSHPSSTSTTSKTSEVANVAYAGSLQLVNDNYVKPSFEKSSGMSYQGRGGGAFGMANLIKAKEITPNVFESIGTAPIASLGSQVTDWAVGFASSPIVIAYSQSSPYAPELNAIAKGQKPLSDLFQLMQQPKFHLGRTNPETDPQGQSFLIMMKLAERELHLAPGTANKILGPQDNPKQVFSEEGILSRLQAGQLDASSAYMSEAIQRHLPFIKLPNTINLGDPAKKSLYATEQIQLSSGKTVKGSPIEIYVTTISGTPNPKAGEAFAAFVLSKQGQQIYKDNGYNLTPMLIWGNKSHIPFAVASELPK
ncbi:substrate-binding domain-containing protein [Alicyclobacillus tolerans]|uniref:extracellular solute-binding protein n=1 Tax=Alicyclobacillus tolerans TaxID=90970 RepID=UPI001F3C923A|nr:extracellular solute-binding protein [Alicyclobacillus tolerans]MCF8565869.1 substrate-binding domain-containing protein [Alicyclobacillus tolerans]